MSLIENYIQNVGFNIQQIELAEYEALVDNFRITNLRTGWVTFLKWGEANDNQAYWESAIGRLRLVLENEIAFDKSRVYNQVSLSQFIDVHNPILMPDEKLNKLLEYVRKQTSYDGEAIAINYESAQVLTALNFINNEECVFYIRAAIKKGLLDSSPVSSLATYLSLGTAG